MHLQDAIYSRRGDAGCMSMMFYGSPGLVLVVLVWFASACLVIYSVDWCVASCQAARNKWLHELDVDTFSIEMRTQFTPIDFLYFAVMAPGADIIKPATSAMRFLVLCQFLTVTALAFRQVEHPNERQKA